MESIVRPALQYVYEVLRMFVQFFRFGVPWLLRVMGFTIQLTGIFSWEVIKKAPVTLKKIADQCTKIAATKDFPTIIIEYLYYAAYGIAFLTMMGEWILLSFLTVFLVRWIFRF